ncbi:ABC transporter ATP-binding protein [Steroidobacter sp.]|uniref:ABC transporter ATP-binding protein n=1 Tax=Steroidobacter sp. TaxID=1978227 RepID=UPI001A46D965|nr:ABC transporter ATP-binding protein [Steroidobacter sp.]MBL8265232.1 ABC transporter ATP-binding protein [Steroidobacter sp.]
MAQLTLENVSKRYGDTVALAATDLTVKDGEFLTLLGPSGCGKTTTLRIVAGFVAPDAGRVAIDGQDVTLAPPRLRHVGMVFQDYALFPHMTVAENIAFGLQERRTPRAKISTRVDEMLSLVQLEALAHRHPAQLSGGQQQRVALARALAHPPRLLLMDEPFSALDARLREGLRTELRRIQRSLGITTLFITHDRQEAMALSDTIGVMQAGRIEQHGTPQEIYTQPKTRFIADFIGPVNVLDVPVYQRTHGPLEIDASEIGVRPENVGLFGRAEAPSHGLQLQGTVLSSSYHGNEIHVLVDIGSSVWTVHLPARTEPPTGEVVLTWAIEDTLRF